MQDNSSNDDETKDSPLSPKLGGKKLKLNDGSSQDSNNETASGSKIVKEENVDSGVSADKSESTSSDAAAAEVPLNEVVTIAPSSSNVRAILLNIRHPRRARNYRKRKTPDRESGSDSSRDSDDLSTEEAENIPLSLDTTDGDAATDFSNGSSSESGLDTSSNSSYHSDDQLNTVDTDSDDPLWSRNEEDGEELTGKPPPVLLKTRPKHTYIMLREIINREMGLTFPCGKTTQNDVIFEQNFYGSLHAVYRLEKLHNLLKHRGCVNSINFHPEGRLLASGSDDMNVVVWDWAKRTPVQTVKTGHKSNVFQSKFLYLNAQSQLNIATCARDGQVRLVQVGGGGSCRRRLAAHARPAHKLAVWPSDPHLVLSAGEDGLVLCADVRDDHPTKMIHAKTAAGGSVSLYSVAVHPRWRHEVLVAGRDKFLRVYDARRPQQPLALYWPGHFRDENTNEGKWSQRKRFSMHLTCAVYNHDGTEILGSYNDEDIYLFNAKNDIYEGTDDTKDGYTHRYSGHRNSVTYKSVAFFGPKSEYIVSGSDCSNIYIWEKNSEAIVQWMKGDSHGAVNCIETHPRFPVMATSGLDIDVKIWIPKRDSDPTYEGIEKVVRKNSVTPHSRLFNDFLPTLFSAWRHENRMYSDNDVIPTYGSNIEFDGNVCTPF
ncbi:DDB1- and CUL4-associated factor 8 [Danaus plexippus]|uniref:DDB1- and CUL4-associated factor 8 n=1 Tax=Danaus plexippus TaxID=13037 RepID=UPI000239C0DD|nr:DDB1- and CUL4-associated factor 8 [Danaus plexippus]XP_032515012.1 DDB1- and CUL4-associated factor 8 [Danaus plexippus]